MYQTPALCREATCSTPRHTKLHNATRWKCGVARPTHLFYHFYPTTTRHTTWDDVCSIQPSRLFSKRVERVVPPPYFFHTHFFRLKIVQKFRNDYVSLYLEHSVKISIQFNKPYINLHNFSLTVLSNILEQFSFIEIMKTSPVFKINGILY
jgi:hypothetical protein